MKGDKVVKVQLVAKNGKSWLVMWEGSGQKVQFLGYPGASYEEAKTWFISQAAQCVKGSADKIAIEKAKLKWLTD
eukprot:1520858-Pyramimonas_sp.AAC.1